MSARDVVPSAADGADLARGLNPSDPLWPALWREMNDPAPGVQVSGRAEALSGEFVAIVGTRRASPRGLAVARGLALQLSTLGYAVVSGLARGIDAAAHQGALDASGVTVGIMATGLDRTYPCGHVRLRRAMQERGCCLTEFAEGTPPLKHHFPRRNRLIAGLARGVIVVEAPLRSGAMLTANLAADYNREVFAVPGPVDLETSRGCHQLLRQGAHLVESAEDVIRVLGVPRSSAGLWISHCAAPAPEPGGPAGWIFDRLDLEGVRRDELLSRWPGREDVWQEGLLALELAGLIRRLPGGRLARRIWTG